MEISFRPSGLAAVENSGATTAQILSSYYVLPKNMESPLWGEARSGGLEISESKQQNFTKKVCHSSSR